jgi:methylated-DNA-[protein]-cysteine S-methyltransferase
MHYTLHDSPVGPLRLTARGGVLCGVDFPNGKHTRPIGPDWVEDAAPFAEVGRQLDAYFAGERQVFDLPLAPRGTAFQLRVWEELRRIPFGHTISYGELARRVGDPNAARAVGAANGQNPISIIVPCHRVIGADGSLTGFGGGVATKRALLEHEQRHAGLFAAATY